MREKTIADFLHELGDKTPTPGGGAVAGLNGAIAAAQLKMVVSYSKNIEPKIDLDKLIDKFLSLAEDDSEAYKKVADAFKSKDSDKIEQSIAKAIEPSEKMLDRCSELLSFVKKNFENFNKNLLSDTIVSIASIKACARSAQAMLAVNSKSVSDKSLKDRIKSKIIFATQILDQSDNLYKEIWSISKDG